MIDAHTHASLNWTPEGAEECFKITGVDRIVLAASPLDHWGTDLNEGCARFVAAFPDKAVGLIGIHPPNVDESLRDIEKYHAKGFVGVKLMPTSGFYPDDEGHRKVFEEVNARKMIVLTHCGWCSAGRKARDLPQCTLYSHPYHLEPLIRVFPDTDFIMAHGGGRTMFQAAFDLVHYHENAWLDTCPGNGTWVLQHAGAWLNHLDWGRVLFGTDTSYGSAESAAYFPDTRGFVRAALRNAGYADREEDVFHNNAERLLDKHGAGA